MRTKSKRHDSVLPWIGFAGVVFGALGWALLEQDANPELATAGPWLLTAGVLCLATAGLVGWSPLGGAIVATGLWTVAGGWFLRWFPSTVEASAYWPLAILVGLFLIVGGVPALRHGRAGSRGVVQRWASRDRRNGGVASSWQVLRHGSRFAVRRKATVLRPSMRQATLWQRVTTPTNEYATRLARVGRLWVWSPVEDVVVFLGGPRTGKTGAMAGRILDAPGAVIATSTRTDLIELTAAVRQVKHGPAYIFNPSGIGNGEFASTIGFDPLSGCEDPKTADDRAGDLISGGAAPGRDNGDREFWESQGRRVLRALMHAAAIGHGSMRDVFAWVADPDAAKTEVQQLLQRSQQPTYEDDALQFFGTNDRTRSSITSTIMPALQWLNDPIAEQAARGGSFDVDQLLAERGTVYLLGAEEAQTAPLVTALTGYIARAGRKIAATKPGGRLDPPLTLALDEAALICPVPLDRWTADMGGRNITIHIAAQSRAQLRQRFGDAGAAALLNNASTLVVFGGTKDPDDLQAYAMLTGERDEDVDTYDTTAGRVASTTTRRVPVVSSAQIAQLPPGRVLLIRRDMPVTVGQVPMAWKRRDVRRTEAKARIKESTEPVADELRRFGSDAKDRGAQAVEWLTARLAQTTEWVRQARADRAARRMRPRIEAIDRDPDTARVITLPAQREPGEDS